MVYNVVETNIIPSKDKLQAPVSGHFKTFKSTNEFISVLKDCTHSDIQILEVLIKAPKNEDGAACLNQKVLAQIVGTTVRTVGRSFAKFKHAGIVQSTARYLKASLYTVSPHFKDPFFKAALRKVFPALASLALFVGSVESCQSENVRGIRDRNIYKKASSLTYRKREYKKGISSRRWYVEQFRQIPKDGKEIPEYIKAIAPHTQLTKWGEMRMAAFPVEAIVFALSQYQNGPILLYDCDKWCEKNGIRPDWTYTKMLNKKHNMPPRAYLFEEDGFTGEAPAQQPKKYNRNTADNSKGGRLPIWKPEEKVIDYAKEYEEFEKAKREDPIFAANLAKLTKMTNPFAVHLTKVVTTQMGMAATQKFTSPPGEPEDIGAQECSQPIHMLRDESNPLAKRIKERMAKMRERDRYR